ncbi:Sec-independent protein translocase component TatC (mitochondrion) [Phytophthora citrophthora]|uniref:Sec-independent protein translocase component TatC n=1 Tax=Phytophthora citrophthora TaxID=4793 RepID=A0AAD9FYK6_9STRA|nr:SecY [Phytophthora citrophthora]KAK1928435.1 Sec-independent protein translocase component TatC [Phytophthora citrophthora]UXG55864.1 SecY [Phytophthora citrophthora]
MKNKIITYLQLHLFELKYNFFILLITFFYLFIISYYFSDQLIYLLVNNLLNQNMLKYFIFTNITEILITNIFIAIFITTFLTIQLGILLIWFFLIKGLYKFENFIFLKFYILFIIFNLFIINFIFTNIIPHIWNFLLNLNFSNLYLLTVYFEPKINNYFDFIFFSFIYIFIIFIYFFFLFFLIFNNIFKIKTIINLRKFFYFKIILLSSLITPPDILNFLLIYIIFIFIFEIFIYFSIYLNKYNIN